jgi:hypothetical protein
MNHFTKVGICSAWLSLVSLAGCGPEEPAPPPPIDCDDPDDRPDESVLDVFGDGIDANCDGVDGEDLDGDGSPGNAPTTDEIYDCDDSDPSLNRADLDGDGVDSCEGDCDDEDSLRFPGNPEVCDGIDNNCHSVSGEPPVDERDSDGDGYVVCLPVDGSGLLGGDCDGLDSDRFPGNPEVCDGVDNDCDGLTPDDEVDSDEDGQMVCAGDCDDSESAIFLGQIEGCDGLDNDCDGAVPSTEVDGDGDGVRVCEGDCNDADPSTVDDMDCDGVLSVDDCDDTDPSTVDDMDCDGVLDGDDDDSAGDDDDSAGVGP